MPTFAYEAIDATGMPTRGTMEAETHDEVIQQLRAGGLSPTRVGPVRVTAQKQGGKVQKKGMGFSMDSLRKLRVNAKLAKRAVVNNPIKSGLAVGALASLLRSQTIPSVQDDAQLKDAQTRLKAEKIAKLMEQARMERAIQENSMRLAQANPNLYTSVLAGRRVPAGSVVLGGRPRMDLMRELAASMGSGRFERQDPLSELMG